MGRRLLALPAVVLLLLAGHTGRAAAEGRGELLVAAPQNGDPRFDHTVILLTRRSAGARDSWTTR